MEYQSDTPNIPDHRLSEKQFLLQDGAVANVVPRAQLFKEIVEIIEESDMAPYYKYLLEQIEDFPFDEKKYAKMAASNESKIAELQKDVSSAEDEEETELDVLATTIKLAEYYTKIVDRSNAVATYKKAFELPQSTGSKIDLLLALTRIDFFFSDYPGVGKLLDQIKGLIDKGGDWERRNRYKTYHGIYLLATRQFSEAGKLLIDLLATFTSTELCTYEQVAQYAITAGVLTLDRVDLKDKIIDSPEILSIQLSASQHLDPLLNLTNSLYTCQYNCFFLHLLELNDKLFLTNKYLYRHAAYFLREMRCKAYGQLLESYKSLSVKSMAHNFNISEDFLDKDLCNFIPNKKLNCTIDKVNGIIETNRPDSKNNQYHLLIKQGDNLLTKLQKYGAAVKLSGAERV